MPAKIFQTFLFLSFPVHVDVQAAVVPGARGVPVPGPKPGSLAGHPAAGVRQDPDDGDSHRALPRLRGWEGRPDVCVAPLRARHLPDPAGSLPQPPQPGR